jgi:hypothetical protein
MQSPKIRRRWHVEGFGIHLVVSMPIDLVDLYDVLYGSLHDGLEVRRTCCMALCATDWKSVVRAVWLFARRTGSPSYVLYGSLYDGLEVRRT